MDGEHKNGFHGILVGPSCVATGFIISKSGHYVTNLHAISEACLTTKGSTKQLQAEAFVTRVGKQKVRLRARVLLADSGIDLALCQIVIPSGISLHVFEFGYSDPRVGQSISTLGNPPCCPNTSRFGFVADVGFSINNLSEEDAENAVVSRKYVPKKFGYILLDLNAASGFSNGPSCDVKGRVIAINQSTSSVNYGYFNLAVLVKYLLGLMLKHIKLGLRGYSNGHGLFDVEGADDDEDDYEDEEEFVSDEDAEVD